MKARGRRAQARADARRIANVRRELHEKAYRERARLAKIKNAEAVTDPAANTPRP